jgi:hypothetical protein
VRRIEGHNLAFEDVDLVLQSSNLSDESHKTGACQARNSVIRIINNGADQSFDPSASEGGDEPFSTRLPPVSWPIWIDALRIDACAPSLS